MLRHTFCHLPGIDSKEEKNLWEKGIYDWKDLEIYLKTEPAPIRNLILDALEFSKKELERENFFTLSRIFPKIPLETFSNNSEKTSLHGYRNHWLRKRR